MRTTEHGTTLIEVMTALMLFSVGILAVAQMQMSGLNCSAKATRNMYNDVTAGNLVEKMLSLPLDAPLLADTDNGFAPAHPDHGPIPIDNTGATIEWEVDDDFAVTGLKRIAVTVRWRTMNGGRRHFTYTSALADPADALEAF